MPITVIVLNECSHISENVDRIEIICQRNKRPQYSENIKKKSFLNVA